MIDPVRLERVTNDPDRAFVGMGAARLVYSQLKDTEKPEDYQLEEYIPVMASRCALALVSPQEEVLATGSIMNTPDAKQKLIVDVATAEGQKRRGMGAIVIAGLEDIAREQRADRVILQSASDAIPFYTELGYSRQGLTTLFRKYL